MKSNSHLLTGLALFVVPALVLWTLTPRSSPTGEEDGANSLPTKSDRASQSASRFSPSMPGQDRMQAIRSASSEPDRIRAAIALARSLPITEAKRWLDEGLFSQREGFALTIFTQILKQRWGQGDPEGFLVWQLSNGEAPSKEELALLAESNPDLIGATLAGIGNKWQKTLGFAHLAEVRPDLALAELQKTDRPAYAYMDVIFRAMAKGDLAFLQESLVNLPPDIHKHARKAVFQQLLQDDFAGNLDLFFDEPDGQALLADSRLMKEMRSEYLSNFHRLPESWQRSLGGNESFLTYGFVEESVTTDWQSYGFTEEQAGSLVGYAFFQVIRNQKDQAVALVKAQTLSISAQKRLIEMLSWNKGTDILAEIQPYLDSKWQDFAGRIIANNPSDNYSNQTDVAALSQELAGLDPKKLSGYSLSLPIGNGEVPRQFVTDYLQTKGEARNLLTTAILNTKVSNLPTGLAGYAVEYALENPGPMAEANADYENRLIRAAAEHAVHLLDRDPAEATRWATGLPGGNTRDLTLKNLAANWRNLDPIGAEAWVGRLPAQESASVRDFLNQRE
ncbi:hypothetical protein V2O64_13280 [Verrucomicrobiaceae bacterium 227]